jgi:hypothetical protein
VYNTEEIKKKLTFGKNQERKAFRNFEILDPAY